MAITVSWALQAYLIDKPRVLDSCKTGLEKGAVKEKLAQLIAFHCRDSVKYEKGSNFRGGRYVKVSSSRNIGFGFCRFRLQGDTNGFPPYRGLQHSDQVFDLRSGIHFQFGNRAAYEGTCRPQRHHSDATADQMHHLRRGIHLTGESEKASAGKSSSQGRSVSQMFYLWSGVYLPGPMEGAP